MKIELDGDVWCGRAIDIDRSEVSVAVDSGTIVEAIRDEDGVVECASPGPLHEYIGWIRPGMNLRTRTALAVAARSQGQSAPQDEDRDCVLERLSALPKTTTVETSALRKRLATTSNEIDRYRERVARLQGQVQARREENARTETGTRTGIDNPNEEIDALEDAIRELSERETEHAAAEQAFDRARERQRRLHDVRDDRLALEDRAANLARDARRYLVRELEAEFEITVKEVQETTAARTGTGNEKTGFDADPVTVALAIARLGVIDAPVVLECDRFPSAQAAADWLDVPVVRL